jgi:hypothetical protein
MIPNSAETLVTWAPREIADIKNACSADHAVTIEQNQITFDRENYKVKVLCNDVPPSPSLTIQREYKATWGALDEDESPTTPAMSTRRFDAVNDGSKYGWLERSTSESLLTTAEIVSVVRDLLLP